jgi:hypothetical protein
MAPAPPGWCRNSSVELPSTVLVGLNGTGVVNITNGGRILSTFMPWAHTGSSGTLRVDGSQSDPQYGGRRSDQWSGRHRDRLARGRDRQRVGHQWRVAS